MKNLTMVLSLACMLSIPLLTGCASLEKAPPVEEVVMQRLQSLIDDVFAGDVDNVMDYVSEDFYHPEAPDKEALDAYIQMGRDMGFMDDVPAQLKEHEAEVDLDDAKVTVEGDTVSIYPIEVSTIMAFITAKLVYKKDSDGVWRVVTGEVEGI